MHNYVKWIIFFVLFTSVFHQVRPTTQIENDQRKEVEKLINSLNSDDNTTFNETETGKTSLAPPPPPPPPHTTGWDCGPGYYLDDWDDCQPCSPGTMDIPDCHAVDPCRLDPCKNGGSCNNIFTDDGLDMVNFKCQCPLPYTGPTCEVIDPCSSNPCKNGGTCVIGPSLNKSSCHCSFSLLPGTNCENLDAVIVIPVLAFCLLFALISIVIYRQRKRIPCLKRTRSALRHFFNAFTPSPRPYDVCIFYDKDNDETPYHKLSLKFEGIGLKMLTPSKLVGGKSLFAELNDKINNSTYVVVIVSEKTAIEGWLEREIHTLLLDSLKPGRKNCVVPILFSYSQELLPKELAVLRCLKFEDSDFDSQLDSTFNTLLKREASIAPEVEPSSSSGGENGATTTSPSQDVGASLSGTTSEPLLPDSPQSTSPASQSPLSRRFDLQQTIEGLQLMGTD